MSKISTGLFLKMAVPLLIVLGGCSMTNRVSQLLNTPAPVQAAKATVVSLPTGTATPIPTIELKITVLPAVTAELTATAPLTETSKPSPTPKPEKTPTQTPTPEPTPGPYSFYLNSYRPSCPDGEPKASVKVVADSGKGLPDVTVELLNGLVTPVATKVTDSKGNASLALGDLANPGWIARVSDESGGGAWVRSVKVARSDLSCQPPYSVNIELQKNFPDNNTWPEYQPISMNYPARVEKAGPWSPQHVRPLNAWPRPAHDNGMGIHFLPIGYYADWVVDLLIGHMKEMHMTWVTVLYNDDNNLRIAAQKFRDAGIMVVWRPNIRPDATYQYMKRDLDILREVGMPPYFQIFNEPEVGQEWSEADGKIRIKRFADNWIKFADEVYAAGGFPGVQMVDPETLPFFFDRVKEKGKEYLFNEMFFVPHPYGSNHPPDYPYDANMQAREPGKTADQDWFGALGFLKYAHVFQEKLGFVPPFVIGEGGWTVTVREDDKYPAVNLEAHRDWHQEVFSWFKNRSLSNGEPLPDYLFAFCPWIIASGNEMVFDQASWYGSEQSGTKKLTIKALRRMPPFDRKFSWDK